MDLTIKILCIVLFISVVLKYCLSMWINSRNRWSKNIQFFNRMAITAEEIGDPLVIILGLLAIMKIVAN